MRAYIVKVLDEMAWLKIFSREQQKKITRYFEIFVEVVIKLDVKINSNGI